MGPEESSFDDEDEPPPDPHPGSTEDDEAPPSEETGGRREHWRPVKKGSETLLISSGELAMDLLEMSYITFNSPSLRRGTLKGVPNCTKNSFVVPSHRVARAKRAGISTSSWTGDGSWASKYDGQARGWDN